ncbi:MAG: MBL fold metallo-hydrolase [Thermodesulfobacteriota bacterium]
MKNSRRYDRPVKIGAGIYWVGYRDEQTNFQCNPFLIVQDDAAVLIDSGSRSDFAIVMMKILQAGVGPENIVALIYQHYDPDLCGSMPNFIDMCDNPDLKVFSEKNNNIFISYYIQKEKYHLVQSIDAYGYKLDFNGRTLQFLPTPYAHNPGSFVTYDEKTKTLFSSDIFGSFSAKQELFLQLDDACFACADYSDCPNRKNYCPLPDIIAFHETVMPCKKSLRKSMRIIKEMDIDMVAPQHGSIFDNKRDIHHIIAKLESLEKVGIDGIE